jgi:glycosyltransferase involved in cell wall biosynthesis
MPKFLIVTPTYPGRAKKLESAVASVRSQIFRDFDHLVVGDGPTPEARAICERYGVRYIEMPEHTGNWGCQCRNYALEHCEADRVLFLDDDNVLLPNCLQSINNACTDNPPIIIHKVLFFNKWTGQWIIMPNAMPPARANIDMLNFCVRSDIAKLAKFRQDAQHELDWFYIQDCLEHAGGQYGTLDEIVAVYF